MRAIGLWADTPDPCADGMTALERTAANPSAVERALDIVQDGPAGEGAFGPATRLPEPDGSKLPGAGWQAG